MADFYTGGWDADWRLIATTAEDDDADAKYHSHKLREACDEFARQRRRASETRRWQIPSIPSRVRVPSNTSSQPDVYVSLLLFI